ncbi:hypothetical protein Tco_0054618 [Tanacetum coccineum]
MTVDEELAKRVFEEEQARFNAEQEARKEVIAKDDQAHDIDWSNPAVIRYHALQNRPRSVAEVRKNMCIYLKNQGGYKMKHFKGMSYEDIRPIAGQDVEEKPAKRQRTGEVSGSVQEQTDEELKTDELSQEQLHQMKIIVPEEGMHVEALQTKYPTLLGKFTLKRLCNFGKSSEYAITQRIDQGLGSTSGIRAYALRNFDLEVMEFESAQNSTTAKLAILKLGEYEMWVIRIK